MNRNEKYYQILIGSQNINKEFIVNLLLKDKEFLKKVVEKINLNPYVNEEDKINLNKQHIENALKPFLNGGSKEDFISAMQRGARDLSYYWNQIYNLFREYIDEKFSQKMDMDKLFVSKDINEIKKIISKYDVKDKEILKKCYQNLFDDENYYGAEYILGLIGDKELIEKFNKERFQQQEFKFGTVSYKIDKISRFILK